MPARATAILGLFLVLLPRLSGQVVFSRRVYRESGPSYQQIWNWNPAGNSLKPLTDSPRNHYRPVCSGDRILFVSPEALESNSQQWSFDRTTRAEKVVGPVPSDAESKHDKGCDVLAAAGPLEACAKGGELSLSRGGKPIGHLRIATHDFPIELLAWSPSRKLLLVGTLGEATSSTSPQSDLFVVDTGSLKLVKAGSGNDEAWLPDRDAFVYTSPRDMASLAGAHRPRGVWVEHLMLYDLASGKTTAITSGVSNNVQPSVCR